MVVDLINNSMLCAVVVHYLWFWSGRPGSNPDWGPIYYEASVTAHGLPEPLSLRVVHWAPDQLNMKVVTGACILIDGSSLELCSATPSVVHLAYVTEMKSIQLHDSVGMALPWNNNISYIYIHIKTK